MRDLLSRIGSSLTGRLGVAVACSAILLTQSGNRTVVAGGEAAVLGEANAPVTLVYFTDYYCTFCREFDKTVLTELRDQFVKSGRLRIVVRDLPLRYGSADAAQAARCAAEQGKYWEYHDALFSAQDSLSTGLLPHIADMLGLDAARFRACQRSELIHIFVQRDRSIAAQAMIPGTPAFIIGREKAGFVSGRLLVGAQPFAAFKAAIDSALP